MKLKDLFKFVIICTSASGGGASATGWSIVPYTGLSQMQDQTLEINGLGSGQDGRADVALETGFVAGISSRFHYDNSRWISEFGWEYRSNDAIITSANGSQFPGGNYASNIFYLNGRYQLAESQAFIPWVGAGLLWTQEIDLDSEGTGPEQSFSTSGSTGYQLMVGADYDISPQLYLTGEFRFSSQSGLDLDEEGGAAVVSDIDYQNLTLSLGVGYRF